MPRQWQQGVIPTQTTLFYDAQSKPKLGAFKATQFGHINPRLSDFNSASVAIKCAFDRDGDDHLSHGPRKLVVYQGPWQAKLLAIEIICSQWASGLMQLTYDFVKKENTVRGAPSFEVPQMHFVRAGLAMADIMVSGSADADGPECDVYLLEEYIDPNTQGMWQKYISNRSPNPLLLTN